jgi:hypothetical protein
MRNIGKSSNEIIKEFNNEIQALFRIKESCNLTGIRDTISGATESIKEFNEIRDSSLVSSKEEKEFDNLQNQYYKTLLELENCECPPVYKGKYTMGL